MPGAELQHDSSDRTGRALNSILGVALESVNAAVEVLLLPSLLLAFFVYELTTHYTTVSYATIGLVPAIATGFWTLGRVPAYLLAGSRRPQQPWAFAAALVRAAAVGILAVVTIGMDSSELPQSARPLVLTFFLCFIVFSLAGGFASLPGAALLRSSIPSESWGAFIRRRAIWSGVLCVLVTLVAARLLEANPLAFPSSYGQIFLAATVCLIAVVVFTATMRESWALLPAHLPLTLSPRSLRQPLHDSRYRRFLLFRILLSATAAIDPFLVIYAVTRLSVPITAIGAFALAGVLGWVLSAPVWFWIERRSGPRSVLRGAAVVRLITPAIALAMPPLAAAELVGAQLLDSALVTTIYGVVFFTIGASLAAQSRANFDYLAALAPRPTLPLYVGMTNSLLAVIAFAPVFAGILIQRSGFEAVFGTAAALGLAAVFVGGSLADTPSLARNPEVAERDLATATRALFSGRA